MSIIHLNKTEKPTIHVSLCIKIHTNFQSTEPINYSATTPMNHSNNQQGSIHLGCNSGISTFSVPTGSLIKLKTLQQEGNPASKVTYLG